MGTEVVDIKHKAKEYHYDIKNIITATVLANSYQCSPGHNSGKCMSVHRIFTQRHKKRGAA